MKDDILDLKGWWTVVAEIIFTWPLRTDEVFRGWDQRIFYADPWGGVLRHRLASDLFLFHPTRRDAAEAYAQSRNNDYQAKQRERQAMREDAGADVSKRQMCWCKVCDEPLSQSPGPAPALPCQAGFRAAIVDGVTCPEVESFMDILLREDANERAPMAAEAAAWIEKVTGKKMTGKMVGPAV